MTISVLGSGENELNVIPGEKGSFLHERGRFCNYPFRGVKVISFPFAVYLRGLLNGGTECFKNL